MTTARHPLVACPDCDPLHWLDVVPEGARKSSLSRRAAPAPAERPRADARAVERAAAFRRLEYLPVPRLRNERTGDAHDPALGCGRPLSRRLSTALRPGRAHDRGRAVRSDRVADLRPAPHALGSDTARGHVGVPSAASHPALEHDGGVPGRDARVGREAEGHARRHHPRPGDLVVRAADRGADRCARVSRPPGGGERPRRGSERAAGTALAASCAIRHEWALPACRAAPRTRHAVRGAAGASTPARSAASSAPGRS
jgi:hypothetical protein